MTDPQKDEHIEELLSKLQGIFGKLSHADAEEIKPEEESHVDAPGGSAEEQHLPSAPAPDPPPTDDLPEALLVFPDPVETPASLPIPALESSPASESMNAPAQDAPVLDLAPPPSLYETTVPLQDPEKLIVPTAVFYPLGREAEAKIVSQKLETMTPKFTRVAFRLRVGVFMTYDPRSDWKAAIVLKAADSKFQAVFVIMDRPLDDVRRKAIAAEIEEQGVYFQEVLTVAIEKKAFYTDVLLGLVFFFDSRRPSAGIEEKAP